MFVRSSYALKISKISAARGSPTHRIARGLGVPFRERRHPPSPERTDPCSRGRRNLVAVETQMTEAVKAWYGRHNREVDEPQVVVYGRLVSTGRRFYDQFRQRPRHKASMSV